MLEFLIIKQHKTTTNIEEFEKDKDIHFYKKGKIDFENIIESDFLDELNFIQEPYQKELNEKGEVEFVLITKTYISLKK